jgi:predicted AAA+ superfamily ATPase
VTILKRKIEEKLIAWKNKGTDRMPLIINGARQVGKPTLLGSLENTILKMSYM